MRMITCEHGGNEVPAPWRSRFETAAEVLATHRGYDPGTLQLARQLAARLDAPLHVSTVTRLLVDLNRSLAHRALFSEWTRELSATDRERVLREHYHPYRQRVEQEIAAAVSSAADLPVLHVSVHSFTPIWNGAERAVDVGLLYDPRRDGERAFCAAWKKAIEATHPRIRVRMNNPYRGIADGLTTHLRRRFPGAQYQGIELEVNQGIVAGDPHRWTALRSTLSETLTRLLGGSAAAR